MPHLDLTGLNQFINKAQQEIETVARQQSVTKFSFNCSLIDGQIQTL